MIPSAHALHAARLFGGVLTWREFAALIADQVPGRLGVERAAWRALAELSEPELAQLEIRPGTLTDTVVIWPQGRQLAPDGPVWGARIVIWDLTRFERTAARGVLLLGRGPTEPDDLAALSLLGEILAMVVFNVHAASRGAELSALHQVAGHSSRDRDQVRRQEMLRRIHDRTLGDLAVLRLRCEQTGAVQGLAPALAQIRADFEDILREEGTPEEDLGARLRAWAATRTEAERQRLELVLHDPAGRLATLEPTLADDAFHIATAAVVNALVHSHATRVTLYLVVLGYLLIQVVDNGNGIPGWPAQVLAGRGLGFPGMLARARRQRGRLLVETLDGQGTEIRVELALDFNPLLTQEIGEDED